MNFYCHGKVLVIQTCTKVEFINPLKAGWTAVPALAGLFCFILFHLLYWFVIYFDALMSCGDRETLMLWGGHALSVRLSGWITQAVQNGKSWWPQSVLPESLRKNKHCKSDASYQF